MAKHKKKKPKYKEKKCKHWRKHPAVHQAFNQAKERDGYKCQMCGSEINLSLHHIFAGAYYPSLRADPLNLVCICETCHCNYHKIFNGYSEHKMINIDTFIVYLRMNQYWCNGEGKTVENKMVSNLIATMLERRKYLDKLAKQDENKRKCKKEVCI